MAVTSARPPTREQKITRAIERARLPARDYRVLRSLLVRATWGTAVIAEQFQPRSVRHIARDCGLDRRTAMRSLAHLEAHGWVMRARDDLSGRGHHVRYALTLGADCDCHPPRPEPKTDAERMRAYRQRRKASRTSDQTTDPPSDPVPVTQPEKGCQKCVTQPEKGCQKCVTKGARARNDAAGQTHFSLRASVRGGEVRGGNDGGLSPLLLPGQRRLPDWEPGSIGHEMNPPDRRTL